VISVVWVSEIQRENSGAPTSKRERLHRAKRKKSLYPIGDVLGPVPGVDVMAKRFQGLLNVGTLSCGLLAVSGVICGSGSSAGGGVFFRPPPGGALGGPGPVWVQLGLPRPPREGAVPDSPV
jgi:hypothetical protein